MEPTTHGPEQANPLSDAKNSLVQPATDFHSRNPNELDWLLDSKGGLRAGWVIAIFILLYRLFHLVFGTFAVTLYPALARSGYSPSAALVSELVLLLPCWRQGA